MSSYALATGVRLLRDRLAPQGCIQESDEQLLQAFLTDHDDGAFTGLVRRHASMVIQVCRRVLGQEQDAEDAIQATFLVLARNAAALRKKTSLASFLHGIAYRTALKARQAAARRHKYEGRAAQRRATDPVEELSWREVRALLDEEIAQLPEAYRHVFILCCLENHSQAAAARRLRLKERTVSHRLARARRQLQQRLARRGVQLTVVLAMSALGTQPATAALLTRTISATTTAQGFAGVSSTVAQLVRETAMTGWLNKLKLIALMALATSLLTGAGVWAYHGWAANESTAPTAAGEPRPASTLEQPPTRSPDPAAEQAVTIQGQVLDPASNAVPRAKLLLISYKGTMKQLGVTAADGRYTVAVPETAIRHWGTWLLAKADGAACDFIDLYQLKSTKPLNLRLARDHEIRGRVVNTEGRPVGGVRVTAESIEIYGANSIDAFRESWMSFWSRGTSSGPAKQIYFETDPLFAATTDADGRFVVRGLGAERVIRLRLRGGGIADTSVRVANRPGLDPRPLNQLVFDHVVKGHLNYRWNLLSGPDVAVIAELEKVILGVVTDADSGKPQPGVVVRVERDSDELIQFPPEGTSDAQGRYEIHGVRKTRRYLVGTGCNPDIGYMASQMWVEDTVAQQPIAADLRIKKGVIVTGKLIDGGSGSALYGTVMVAILRGNPHGRQYPTFSEHVMAPCESADDTDAGRPFRVVTIPGPVLLMAKPEGRSRIHYKDTGVDGKYPQYFSHGHGYYGYNSMWPLQGVWNKVLDLKPGISVVKQDIVLERAQPVALVRVQDSDGRPLTGAWAAATGPSNYVPYGWMEDDLCQVYGEPIRSPQLLVFYHRDRNAVSTKILKGNETGEVIVKLGAPGVLTGRLLDAAGQPLADVVVDVRYRDRAAERTQNEIYDGKKVVTNADGGFQFVTVIPDLPFELAFRRGRQRFAPAAPAAEGRIQVKAGEHRDLGSVPVRLLPQRANDE
jgi:RNA polymerase sigma factor (sigma-70 family)